MRGGVKFGGQGNSAPFPSSLVVGGLSSDEGSIALKDVPRKTPGPRPLHRPPSLRMERVAFRHGVKRNSGSAPIPASFAPGIPLLTNAFTPDLVTGGVYTRNAAFSLITEPHANAFVAERPVPAGSKSLGSGLGGIPPTSRICPQNHCSNRCRIGYKMT